MCRRSRRVRSDHFGWSFREQWWSVQKNAAPGVGAAKGTKVILSYRASLLRRNRLAAPSPVPRRASVDGSGTGGTALP